MTTFIDFYFLAKIAKYPDVYMDISRFRPPLGIELNHTNPEQFSMLVPKIAVS